MKACTCMGGLSMLKGNLLGEENLEEDFLLVRRCSIFSRGELSLEADL